jgi:hypothetical protein
MCVYYLRYIAPSCRSLIQVSWLFLLLLTIFVTAAVAETPTSQEVPPISGVLVYSVIIFVLALILFGIATIRVALSNSTWSLADALSEEAEVTFKEKIGDEYVPKFDDNMKPVTVTQLVASSSRLIALIGLIAILAMFVGFGAFTLYRFAFGQDVSKGIDDVMKFLLGGMTMFAPYIINKFASIFDWMTPKKS